MFVLGLICIAAALSASVYYLYNRNKNKCCGCCKNCPFRNKCDKTQNKSGIRRP